MRLSLEPTALIVQTQDPDFPLARMWRGQSEDGDPIFALVLCIRARTAADQPGLDERLAARLPAPEMFVQADEAALRAPRAA